MQITIAGRNIELTDALKKHVTDKLQPLAKRFDKIQKIHVVLQVENLDHIAEAQLHSTVDISASAKSDDMYQAIDELADKLLTQVTKHKEKLIDQHR